MADGAGRARGHRLTASANASASALILALETSCDDTCAAVVTGDGEMLMGMGSLATVGAQRPGDRRFTFVAEPDGYVLIDAPDGGTQQQQPWTTAGPADEGTRVRRRSNS